MRHYMIKNRDDGGFHITARRSFSSIMELVKHYRGVCVFVGLCRGVCVCLCVCVVCVHVFVCILF